MGRAPPDQSNSSLATTATSPPVHAFCQFYSPATDSWVELSAAEAHGSQVAGVVDGEIVVQVRDRTYKGTIQWSSG